MHKDLSNDLPKGCRWVELPRIADNRGELAFCEGMNHIPFEIKRIFWTYNIKDTSIRGDHAHRTCSMVLFPMGGSYRIELDDGYMKKELLMDDPHRGMFIPPNVWCRLYDFQEHATCVSLASEVYTAEDYIHDYEEFLQIVRQ